MSLYLKHISEALYCLQTLGPNHTPRSSTTEREGPAIPQPGNRRGAEHSHGAIWLLGGSYEGLAPGRARPQDGGHRGPSHLSASRCIDSIQLGFVFILFLFFFFYPVCHLVTLLVPFMLSAILWWSYTCHFAICFLFVRSLSVPLFLTSVKSFFSILFYFYLLFSCIPNTTSIPKRQWPTLNQRSASRGPCLLCPDILADAILKSRFLKMWH